MKQNYFILSALCALPFSAAYAETYGTSDFAAGQPVSGDDITISSGTVIHNVNKVGVYAEPLIQVEDGGTLNVEPGVKVDMIVSDEDAGLISLGEGAEATITGPFTAETVQANGSGGVVYMGEGSKLTLRTENAGDRIEMNGNEEDVPANKLGTPGKGYPNDIYMEKDALLTVDTAEGSVIVLGSGVESADTATLFKVGSGTLELGDTSFFDAGAIVVKEGMLRLLQEELTAASVEVQTGAALNIERASSIVQAESVVFNGQLNFVYSSVWENNVDGLAALTLASDTVSLGETSSVSLTLPDSVLESLAEGGEFFAYLIDVNGLPQTLSASLEQLLESLTVLNVQGQAVSGVTVSEEKGRITVVAIPEPATATLSLLALAALCARRRRA